MAETSTMLSLGTPLPPFRLTDAVSARMVDATELARGKKGLLVVVHLQSLPVREAHPERAGARLARGPRPGLRGGGGQLQRRGGVSAGRAGGHEAAGDRGALAIPVRLRRDPGGRPRVPRRLHARSLPVRRRAPAGLPRPVRRQPPLAAATRDRGLAAGRHRRPWPRGRPPSPRPDGRAWAATSSGSPGRDRRSPRRGRAEGDPRGRRARGGDHQPGEGLLPRGGHHQARAGPLLPGGRRGRAARRAAAGPCSSSGTSTGSRASPSTRSARRPRGPPWIEVVELRFPSGRTRARRSSCATRPSSPGW